MSFKVRERRDTIKILVHEANELRDQVPSDAEEEKRQQEDDAGKRNLRGLDAQEICNLHLIFCVRVLQDVWQVAVSGGLRFRVKRHFETSWTYH